MSTIPATSATSTTTTMGEYIPAPYLVATSSLTDEQLRLCYQDFARSLEFAETAPTLVFERLVANIFECLKSVARDTPSEARPPAAPPRESSSSNAASSSQAIKYLHQPAIGTFHTAEVLLPGTFTGASRFTSFPQPYATPPRIVTGLRNLSIGSFGTLRTASYARAITCSDFTIYVDDYSKSRFNACASWLSVAPEDPYFQVGTFSTTVDHPSSEKRCEVWRHIVFERPYAHTPQITVWFSGFQFEPSGKLNAETWCEGITSTGFILNVSMCGEATLADVAWAACDQDRPNTLIGSFGASQLPPGGKSGLDDLCESGSDFDEESTSVFLAINSIIADKAHGLDLKISCLKVDTSGLSWHLSTGDSSQVTKVGAAFIVLG